MQTNVLIVLAVLLQSPDRCAWSVCLLLSWVYYICEHLKCMWLDRSAKFSYVRSRVSYMNTWWRLEQTIDTIAVSLSVRANWGSILDKFTQAHAHTHAHTQCTKNMHRNTFWQAILNKETHEHAHTHAHQSLCFWQCTHNYEIKCSQGSLQHRYFRLRKRT